MPRLSADASKMVRVRFTPWLTTMLKAEGVSPSAIVYGSRQLQHEVPHSNLSRILEGRASPTPSTVLAIVETLAPKFENAPSTPAALYYSHPGALVRLIAGLSAIDDEREPYVPSSQLDTHMRRRIALQERLAETGGRAFQGTHQGRTIAWLREVAGHLDLLAIVVAYCYFCGRGVGNLYDCLSRNDPELEALYASALRRYPVGQKKPRRIAESHLAAAESIADNWSLTWGTRFQAISALLHAWSWGWAMPFVIDLLPGWQSDID